MDSSVSILGKIHSETRIHPERLRHRVKDKRRLNTLHQTEPVVAGGVGRSHSLPTRKISTHRPSIVDRLAARSVTGQSLNIHVHQHVGYRVHFEWDRGTKAMERRFHMHSDAETFCEELCKFGLEGLCTCVYETYHSFTPENTPRCLHGPFYPSQKYLLEPKWWLKFMEESSVADLCGCKISSSKTIEWHWTPKNKNPSPINEGPHLRL
jgi:hypothetical protein